MIRWISKNQPNRSAPSGTTNLAALPHKMFADDSADNRSQRLGGGAVDENQALLLVPDSGYSLLNNSIKVNIKIKDLV